MEKPNVIIKVNYHKFTAVVGEKNSMRFIFSVIVNANYYILATDYTNYALVFSCRDVSVDGEESSLGKFINSAANKPDDSKILRRSSLFFNSFCTHISG